MALDGKGFLRPHLNDRPTLAEDDLIDQVCPAARLNCSTETRVDDPTWGKILSLCTGHASDSELRFKGASGGALSALLQHLLSSGSADYVLHVGPNLQAPLLNAVGESRCRDAIVARAGSRYAPSAPLADIVERLEKEERFVFVGKPCDVAALRMYLAREGTNAHKVVLMVSFLCGGVPSERGARALLSRMGVAEEELSGFRYRGHGWPGRATATTKDGRESSLSYSEAWGSVLSHHVQLRCKICPDGTGRFADIVFGDAWFGDERGYPSFEDREGRSLIVVRTDAGRRALADAVQNSSVELEPLPVKALELMQPFQARRTRLTMARILALKLMGRKVPRYRGLRLWRAATKASIPAQLRAFFGAIRRAVLGRL